MLSHHRSESRVVFLERSARTIRLPNGKATSPKTTPNAIVASRTGRSSGDCHMASTVLQNVPPISDIFAIIKRSVFKGNHSEENVSSDNISNPSLHTKRGHAAENRPGRTLRRGHQKTFGNPQSGSKRSDTSKMMVT